MLDGQISAETTDEPPEVSAPLEVFVSPDESSDGVDPPPPPLPPPPQEITRITIINTRIEKIGFFIFLPIVFLSSLIISSNMALLSLRVFIMLIKKP